MYGLEQAVGPAQPEPPHWAQGGCTLPVLLEATVVITVVVVIVVVVVLVVG